MRLPNGLLVKWNHSALSRRSHGVSTRIDRQLYARVAQRQEAGALGASQCQFESDLWYHLCGGKLKENGMLWEHAL